MKLYKLGLRVDQKTVVKLPKMYNKTNPTVLAVGYQFIASAANSPFGLLYNMELFLVMFLLCQPARC